MLTRYEFARLAASPIFPAFDARVRRDLRSLLRDATGPHTAQLLDVGGRTSPFTVGLPASVTVIDLPRENEVQKALALGMTDEILADLRRRRSNIDDVRLEDMTRSTAPDRHFDGVMAVEVIEHVPDDERFVAEVARVLRADGWAYLTTPNGDYIRNEPPHHNPDHLRHYSRDAFETLLRQAFRHVHVDYAIRTGKNRYRGQRFRLSEPRSVVEAAWWNGRSRWESRQVSEQPRRTANLIAVARGPR